MDASFDPYRKWLGVRSRERPPNHYQLLGLELFEDDPETISHAADQRIVYVRTLAVNEYADVSQRVLNELAAAKVALLSRDKKISYDARLRAQFADPTRVAASPTAGTLATTPAAQPTGMADNRPQALAPEAAAVRQMATAGWPKRQTIMAALCAALTLPIAYLFVALVRQPARPQISHAAPSRAPLVLRGSIVTDSAVPNQESSGPRAPNTREAKAPVLTDAAPRDLASPPDVRAAQPQTHGADPESGSNQADASALNVTAGQRAENAGVPMEPAPAASGSPATKPVVQNPTSRPLNSPAAATPKSVEPLRQYKAQEGPVTSIAFNIGGKSFVSAGGGKFLVWNVGVEKPMVTVHGQTGDYRDVVALSSKGTHIIRASRSGGNVEVYDAVRRRGIIKSIRGYYNQAGFTPDGEGIFCVKRDEVEGWSLATGEIVKKIARFRDDPLQGEWCKCADISKDGDRALTAGRGVISLWDLAKRKINDRGDVFAPAIKHIQLGDDKHAFQICFVGDTQHAVTISDDDRHYGRDPRNGDVRYWDLQAGTEVAAGNKLPAAFWINACPGRFRVFIRGSDGILYVDDETAGKAMPANVEHARANCMAASPDGETLLTGDNKGVIRQWDVSELLAAGANVDSRPAARANLAGGVVDQADAMAAAPARGTADAPGEEQPLAAGTIEYNGHPLAWWFEEYKKHYHYDYSFERDQRSDRHFADKQAALTALEREKESASALGAAARSDPRALNFYLESLAASRQQTKVALRDVLQWLDQSPLSDWTDDLDVVDDRHRRHRENGYKYSREETNGWNNLPEEIRRSYMAIFIARVGPDAIPTLIAALEEPHLRHAAVVSLSLFGVEGLLCLLPLYNRGSTVEDRRLVMQAIATSRRAFGTNGGDQSVLSANTVAKLRAVLLNAAHDEDSPTAYTAADTLVRWKALPDDCGERALPSLKRLLHDQDDGIRRRAIGLLCELGRKLPAAFQELSEAIKAGSPVLSNDKDSFLIDSHNNVTGEWRFLSGPEAVPVLLALLEFSGDEGKLARSEINVLRNNACRTVVAAYTAAPKPEIIDALRKLLADRDVQASAAKSLGEIGPAAKEVLPELTRLAVDVEASDITRTFAKAALKRIAP